MDIEAIYEQATTEITAGRLEEAQRLLARVLQVDPRHARAWQSLALIVPEMDRAIECLNRALEVDPLSVEARSYLSLAREVKRREEEPEAPVAAPITTGVGTGDFDGVPRLGKFLVEAKFISAAQLQAALAAQLAAASAGKPQRLGEILVERGAISAAQLGFMIRHQQQRHDSLAWD